MIVVVSAKYGQTDTLKKDLKIYSNESKKYKFNRHHALYMATGEIQSSAALSVCIDNFGYSSFVAMPQDIDLVATGDWEKARLLSVDVNKLLNLLEKYGIVIIPGFFAASNLGFKLLGRGSSDTVALFLAKNLIDRGIEVSVNLKTDVKGVYRADPFYVPASKIDKLYHSEMQSLLVAGFTKMSPTAAKLAKENHIEYQISSVFFNEEGTFIVDDEDDIRIASLVINKIAILNSDDSKLKVSRNYLDHYDLTYWKNLTTRFSDISMVGKNAMYFYRENSELKQLLADFEIYEFSISDNIITITIEDLKVADYIKELYEFFEKRCWK